jgi:acetyl-CoA C-acetyltransferase
VPDEKLNPNGGAIAMGHPVGASGARLLVSTIYELERIDGELGYITMCQGGSLGIAVVVQRLR